MDKGNSVTPIKTTMNSKINCKQIKQIISKNLIDNNFFSFNTCSTLEVHGNSEITEKMILDIRTYLCAHGKCQLQHQRSHRRLSNFNWNKMLNLSPNINQTISLANKLFYTLMLNLDSNKTSTRSIAPTQSTKKQNCVYCNNPKLNGFIHIHFVKEKKIKTKDTNNKTYKPIETVFTQIDEIAEENGIKIRTRTIPEPPRKKIEKNDFHRMSYGDLNYYGNNKALLYFYRGIRGTQTFTNSMYPLEYQPKHKDIIVVDEIVFTSTCKCDSDRQHREMFPHYRVTCAAGLTCPARLNNFEREIYKRSRNASTEFFTTARAMLSRYWR